MVWQRFIHATPNMTWYRRLKALPGYLKGSWFKENNTEVVRHAAERVWRSLPLVRK